MRSRNPSQPEWKERISKLSDHLKTMFLMLSHEPRVFAMMMAMANLTNSMLEEHQYWITKRLHKPKGDDGEIADSLISQYENLLSQYIARVPAEHSPPIEIVQPEPITEERMAQVACAIKARPDCARVHTVLFLAKMCGAKVDFEFTDFPACPYSPGVRAHIDEGLRLGLFHGFQKLVVKDKVIRDKIPKKLKQTLKEVLYPRKSASNTLMIGAHILYRLSRGEWGPKMFENIMYKHETRISYWKKARELVFNVLRRGHMDPKIFPAGLPEGILIPEAAKGMKSRTPNRKRMIQWWIDVQVAVLRAFRNCQDVSANGLKALWPHV